MIRTFIFCLYLLCSKTFSKEEAPTFAFLGIQIPKQQLQFATLDDNNNKTQDYLLDPNPKRNLTLSFHHKDISLFAGLPIIDEEQKIKGKSETLDFRFQGKFKEFLPRVYFTKYKGFELKDELNNSASLGFLTEVETLHYGASISYFLEESYTSHYSGQSFYEKLISAEKRDRNYYQSYLLSAGYDYLKIEGLPASTISSSFSSLNGESDFKSFTLNGGTNLQYFSGGFVVEGSFAVGPGYTWYQAQTGVRKSRITLNASIDLLLAYHMTENYLINFNVNSHIISGKIEGADLTNTVSSLEISIGRKF